MRIRFQRRPVDILAALVYTWIVSLAILVSGSGTLWALLLVTFVPGYVTVAALFPGQGLQLRLRQLLAESEGLIAAVRAVGVDRKAYREALVAAQEAAERGRLSDAVELLDKTNNRLAEVLQSRRGTKQVLAIPPRESRAGNGGIDWIERIALSFGSSIALVSLLVILLNFTPFGIRLESIVGILLVYTTLAGIVAARRRLRLPVADRLSGTIVLTSASSRGSSTVDRALAVLLGASIVFAGGVVAYVALTPRPMEQFTQFFLLDRNGTVDPMLYPTRLNVSELGTVIMVLVNNESARVAYAIRIDLVGVEFVYNPTTRLNETIERNRTTEASFAITLEDRDVWRQAYTFAIDAPGDWIVEFLLVRDGNFTGQYLQLRVQVLPRP